MRKLLWLLIFLLLPQVCCGAEYYLFIEKHGYPGNEIGDVVAALPATSQYEPTKGELQAYQIIKVDLEPSEVQALKEPKKEASTKTETHQVGKEDWDAFLEYLDTHEDVQSYTVKSRTTNMADSSEWVADIEVSRMAVTKDRKVKVDFSKLNLTKQKQEVTKSALQAETINK